MGQRGADQHTDDLLGQAVISLTDLAVLFSKLLTFNFTSPLLCLKQIQGHIAH